MKDYQKFILSFSITFIIGVLCITSAFFATKKKSPEPKKLYFEIRNENPKEEINGFIKYQNKWCSIVLNDTLAIIYQK